MAYDGERGITFRAKRGEQVREWTFAVPLPIYRGVFKAGGYQTGDAVTWRGSLWIARRPTDATPDEASADWTLCAKKGRDGTRGPRGDGGV